MKITLTFALILTVLCGVASAENFIGIYNEEGGTSCTTDLNAFENTTLYIVAWLDQSVPSLTATEFSILNFPEIGSLGNVTASWNTPLVIGNLSTISHRFALAFPTPADGPRVVLGSMFFFSFSDQWLGDDHIMIVREHQDSGTLSVVDATFETLPATGYSYTFNCTTPENCDCDEYTPTQDTSWGAVKALY